MMIFNIKALIFYFPIFCISIYTLEAKQVQLRVPISHTGSIQGVALSNDNRFAITAGADKTLKLWEGKTGIQIKSLELYDKADRQAVFMSDNQRVLVQTDNGWQYWDVMAGKRLYSFNGYVKYPGEKMGFCISKDGKKGIVYRKQSIDLYSSTDGKLVKSYPYSNNENHFQIGSRRLNNNYFINVNYGVSARLLDLVTGSITDIKMPEGDISYFDISPVANTLLVSTNSSFYRYDLKTNLIKKLSHESYNKELVFSNNGAYYMIGNDLLAQTIDNTELGYLKGLDGHDRTLCFNDRYVVSFNNRSGGGNLLTLPSRTKIRDFKNETSWLLNIAVNQKDQQLLFSTGDNAFRIWDLGRYAYSKNVKMKGAEIQKFDWYGSAFAQQSRYYLANDYYSKCIFDAETGEKKYETKDDLKAISSDAGIGAFHGDNGGTIRNLQSGKIIAVTAYGYPQYSFSPDNKHPVYYSTVASAARHIVDFTTGKDYLMDAVVGDALTYNTTGTKLYASNNSYYCKDCIPTFSVTDMNDGKTLSVL